MCALHADGTPRRNVALEDGVALKAAKRKKVRAYPELVGPNSRAQLVVLAVKVGADGPVKREHFGVNWPRLKRKRKCH